MATLTPVASDRILHQRDANIVYNSLAFGCHATADAAKCAAISAAVAIVSGTMIASGGALFGAAFSISCTTSRIISSLIRRYIPQPGGTGFLAGFYTGLTQLDLPALFFTTYIVVGEAGYPLTPTGALIMFFGTYLTVKLLDHCIERITQTVDS